MLNAVESRRRRSRAQNGRVPAWFWLLRVAFVAGLLLLWEFASSTPSLRASLPGPGETIGALVQIVQDPELWLDVFYTFRSAIVGLAISTVGGVILGLLIGASKFLQGSTSFTIDFLRTVPGLAVVPLGILVLGPTMGLDVFMIVFSAIWAVIIQSIAAVRNLDPAIKEMAAVYRIVPWRKYFQVLLPACLPAIAAGIRIAAVLSLLLAVGTELLTGSPGLGSRIALYQENSIFPALYACVLLAAVLGVTFNALVRVSERRALRWYFLPREMARS